MTYLNKFCAHFPILDVAIVENDYGLINDTLLQLFALWTERKNSGKAIIVNSTFFGIISLTMDAHDAAFEDLGFESSTRTEKDNLTGMNLIFSGVCSLILGGVECNVPGFIECMAEIIPQGTLLEIEVFLKYLLDEALSIKRPGVATPLFFNVLNMMDRAIYSSDIQNILSMMSLFSDIVKKQPKYFKAPNADHLLSWEVQAYRRDGRSAWRSMSLGVRLGNEACFKAATLLFSSLRAMAGVSTTEADKIQAAIAARTAHSAALFKPVPVVSRIQGFGRYVKAPSHLTIAVKPRDA